MTAPKKVPANQAAAPAKIVSRAAEVLQDPKVRAQILEQGRIVSDAARRWQADRRQRASPAVGPGVVARLGAKVAERVGASRLEHRATRLREAVDRLGEGRQDLADALAPVGDEIDEIRAAIPVAVALTGRSRRRVLSSLDDRLDALESTLADILLPAGP